MDKNLNEKLKNIVGDVLGADANTINDYSSPDNIEAWDSLKQMNIVLAIENEFRIQFSDEQVVNMLSYKLIRLCLEETLAYRTPSEVRIKGLGS